MVCVCVCVCVRECGPEAPDVTPTRVPKECRYGNFTRRSRTGSVVVCVALNPARDSLWHKPLTHRVGLVTCLAGVGHTPIPSHPPTLQGLAAQKRLSRHNCSIWKMFYPGPILGAKVEFFAPKFPLHMACTELFEPIFISKRANAHRTDKNAAIKALRRVSDVCETLVQKCDAHKALIRAIGADDMPAHLQVDDTHKEFPFTPEQKAKWEVPQEEKAVLQMGLTTWQKQLSTQKSAKEKKRVQEKRHKLKGEVALQREILAKAEKKAAHLAEKKAAKKSSAPGSKSWRPRSESSYGGTGQEGQEGQRLPATERVRG